MTTSVADFLSTELTANQAEEVLGQLELPEVVSRHLWDGRVFMRRNAALVSRLAGSVPAEWALLLAVATKDSDPLVRERAILALARVDGPLDDVVPALLRALADPEDLVRAAARDSLYNLATRRRAELAPHLVRGLRDASPEASFVAADLLATPEAVGDLVEALDHPVRAVREVIVAVLVRLGDRAARALVRALEDPVRRALAGQVLLQIAPLDAAARAELDRLAASDDRAVKRVVLALLEAMGAPRWDAEPLVIPTIPIDGWGERSLEPAEIDAAAAGSIPTGDLLLALRDGRPDARMNAVAVLGRRAQGDEAADAVIFALSVVVRDHVAPVRRAAVDALAGLGGRLAVGAILAAVADVEPGVARAARAHVEALGPKAAGWLLDAVRPAQAAAVMAILVGYGAAAVPALAAAVVGHAAAVRAIAAAALEGIGAVAAEAVPSLIRGLDDENDDVRMAAARALGAVARPTDAVHDALAAARRRGTRPVADAAAQALLRLWPTSEPVVPRPPVPIAGFEERPLAAAELAAPLVDAGLLVAALQDGRAHVRHNAALALGALGAGAPALIVALRDADGDVRRAAAQALGRLGASAEVVCALVDALGTVPEAAPALAGLGAAALPGLVAALDRSPDAAAPIARALASFGAAAVEPLGRAFAHPSVHVRANAAAALALLAPGVAAPARAALEAARADADDLVRAGARRALDALDGITPPPRVLPPDPIPVDGFEDRELGDKELDAAKVGLDRLVRALGDGRRVVRRNAAAALATLGARAEAAGPALTVVLRDADPIVRRAAARALGRVGAGADAVRALAAAFLDPDREVVEAAAQALSALGAAALPGLVAALDIDPDLAEATVIPAIVPLGRAAVELLVRSLDHHSVRARANAAAAIAAIGRGPADPARPALALAVRDPDAIVRENVRRALEVLDNVTKPPRGLPPEPIAIEGFEERELGDRELEGAAAKVGVDRLERALIDGRPLMRRNAAVALGALGPTYPGAVQLAVAARDPDAGVRAAAVDALARAAGAANMETVVAALAGARVDRDGGVRGRAAQALTRLGAAALPGLVAVLDRDPELAGYTVVPHLVALGPAAIDALVPLLDSAAVRVRTNAAAVLGLLDAQAARARLEAVARESEHFPRLAARRALALLDGVGAPPEPPEPMPMDGFDSEPLPLAALKKQAKALDLDALRRLLFEGREPVRENAARAFQLLGKKAEDGLPALYIALKDTDDGVRTAAAESLAALKADAERAVPALAGLMRHRSAASRAAALEAVAAYGDAAVAPLVALLAERGPRAVPVLAAAARRIAELVKPVAARLAPAESPIVRENALDVLAELGAAARPATGAVLEVVAGERDLDLRIKAIATLASVATLDEKIEKTLAEVRASDLRFAIQNAIGTALDRLRKKGA
jgi:HEAT repeat protein